MNKIDKVIDYLYETNGDFVDKAEIIGLKSKISKLEWENLQLKETVANLQTEHEDDWEDN